MIHALQLAGLIILSGVVALLLSMLLGGIAGVYLASRERSFQQRALKLATKNGRHQDFVILAGDPALVDEVYSVAIATTKRVQEAAANKPQGIALDDQEKNSDRS